MELGATVCHPKNPDCASCPVQRSCVARRENMIDRIPAKAQPTVYIHKQIDVYLITRNCRYLVQQRPEGKVNAGFWEFPNTDSGNQFVSSKKPKPIATARHTITRYRIELRAFAICSVDRSMDRNHHAHENWRTLAQLRKLPFTAGHRKLLKQLVFLQKRLMNWRFNSSNILQALLWVVAHRPEMHCQLPGAFRDSGVF